MIRRFAHVGVAAALMSLAYVRTPEVTAVWPSGAKTTFWTVLKVGDDRATTLQRPSNAPGLAVDEAHAAETAAAATRDGARQRASALTDEARASARCQAQQKGGLAAVDDCK